MKWHDVVYDVYHCDGDDGIAEGWYYLVFEVVSTDAKGTKKLESKDPIGPFETDEDAMLHFDSWIANGDAGEKVKTTKRGLWSRVVYPKGTKYPGKKVNDES